jgi:hypothetical protein
MIPVTLTDPKIYFAPGACHFSLELVKLFTLYLARTSTGMLEERVTATTVRHYISQTLAAAYRCTGRRQLGPKDLEQVFIYIKVLERDRELSSKVRGKPVALANDLDLLIEAALFRTPITSRSGAFGGRSTWPSTSTSSWIVVAVAPTWHGAARV